MPPIRWLHLSDFHVGKDDYATRKMFDYILTHVLKRKSEGFVPDLLFITGDLTNKGLTSEYESFWLDFLSPLQEAIGNGVSERTFVVPGNHDVDRSKFPAFSQADVAKPESHYLDPTEEGAKLRGDLLIPRFHSYIENDCSIAKGAFESHDGAYAHCLVVHDHEVGIVGINTAWLSKDDRDAHQLTPGKLLLEKALDSIKSAKLRIVLGHHPIDWFLTSQQKPIKSLLGQHHVLYLHGHLHDAWAEPSYGGGHLYLAIQSGAGFQAREGEPWRNGLVWGEADLQAGVIGLQPWRWTPDQQAWTPATDAFHEQHRQGDWWHYPLPSDQAVKVDYAPVVPMAPLPKGWSVFKPDDLAIQCQPLNLEAALRYFDGAVPDWSTALSASIPRRHIVGDLVDRFRHAESSGKPIVSVLLAAACEGKTTALLQAAYNIVKGKNDFRILQRRDESQPLVPDEILPLLNKKYIWLLLLDEADRAAAKLQALLKSLPLALHGRVHALLACRDADWLSSPAADLDWSFADFDKQHLRGLDSSDAQAIVQTWHAFGDAGLGDLAKQPAAKWATILERQAKREAQTKAGAFFGALLAVRSGSGLRKHAHLLLDRLGQRKIPSGGTLRDAIAYIAAMHLEGLDFLSRPVLAQVLGCPMEKLHRNVLVPLGQEAAATSSSSSIFTRHRRIAETLVSVLEDDFAEDVSELYVALGKSAIVALSDHALPENPKKWRYEISDHFLDTGRKELAIRIAEAVLKEEPTNTLTRTHVASLCRRAGLPEHAARLFENITAVNEGTRSLYYEWAVTMGECNHPAENAFLAAFSLADQCPSRQIDSDGAMKSLAGLGFAFGELHNGYYNPAFRDARMAVAVLGLCLHPNATTKRHLDKHASEAAEQGAARPNHEQAIRHLHDGIAATIQIGLNHQIVKLLPSVVTLTFDGLKDLVYHSSRAKK